MCADGKRSGSNSQAAQEAFEASYARLVEKPGESGTSEQQVTRLKICGLSRQRIPMISSAATAAIKMRRATSQWPKSDEPLCLGNYGASDCRIEVQGAVVIGCGGIVQGVTVTPQPHRPDLKSRSLKLSTLVLCPIMM